MPAVRRPSRTMTRRTSLDRGWAFRRLDPPDEGVNGTAVSVDLPHTPFTPDLDGNNHWFGLCEYRRTIHVAPAADGGRHALFVGAAMHTAEVFVDGSLVARHQGGYLGFEIDLTAALADGAEHDLTLRLDNRPNPDVPPGKPFDELDFCWYGGLYRDVELRHYPAVHITEPLAAGEVAGGGVFMRTLEASEARARLAVRTHLRNSGPARRSVRVQIQVMGEGRVLATDTSDPIVLPSGGAASVESLLEILRPQLWSPASPALHEVSARVLDLDGSVLDERTERVGLRRIAFSRSGGFAINGRRLRLRGTNRHQEFPYAGHAAPRAAQWRDARRIKDAGFDCVRLSHYPQSPHFLDACDALGIVVMNAIPGWQFIGGPRFREACFENARALVRRDRNHACVVLWELSLNETAMDEAFIDRLHGIGHEEMPGDQMFTCGWIDRYDVFLHSRQHGRIHTWKNGDKALVIAEYGDWEFFAADEGFDQKSGNGRLPAWKTSRKFRADGERGLLQQAWNHVAALDDTLSSPAVLDGQWAVFDYARGYDSLRAGVGVMDVFRLPKFSFHFYRSQRHPDDDGAMVFVASHWTPSSSLRVLVFGNCDEVELRLNGRPVGRRRPDRAPHTHRLPHPPWIFELPAFEPGTLEALGYVDGRAVAAHLVSTPGEAARLELAIDDAGICAGPGEPDLLVAHARICDARGTLCVEDTRGVRFGVSAGARIVGPAEVAAEAGIASVVLRVPAGAAGYTLEARTARSDSGLLGAISWPPTPARQRAPAALLQMPP